MNQPGHLTVIFLFASTLGGQTPVPSEPDPTSIWSQAFGLTRVDGTLHAAGPTYAARITAAGVEFVPAFGPRADRPYSLGLRLLSIHRGSTLIHQPTGVDAAPREDGLRVVIPRGTDIEERFDVRRDGIEHSFVFAQPLTGSGDLVVTLEAQTELACCAGEELCFAKPRLGSITVGAVTGIDAAGRRNRRVLAPRGGSY
jgi:hypothetical protein